MTVFYRGDKMIEMLTSLILSAAQSLILAATPVQTCVWPNRCAKDAVAQVQPCVWPNRCAKDTAVLAQFQPCVWPNRCSKEASGLI